MELVLSVVSTVVGWGLVFLIPHGSTYTVFGIMIFPVVGVIASVLYLLLPKIFSIGTANEDGSILGKALAFVLVLAAIAALQCLPRTIVTVGLTSFWVGAGFTYIGKFASNFIGKKPKLI